MPKDPFVAQVAMKTITTGGTNTMVVAAATRWRLIGLRGTPAGHAEYISTSRNFSVASGVALPALTTSGSWPWTWLPWPPGVDIWAIGSPGDGIQVIELPWPPGGMASIPTT